MNTLTGRLREHDRRPILCEECGYVAKSRAQLQYHTQEHQIHSNIEGHMKTIANMKPQCTVLLS